ncbi:unnamed protein product [Paramecium octaurelia]|uniref:Uncharacterized protein n=1 Tax=Paramecium octaurelia TaxID=43137 RepID=A0A8S1UN68_PAROT|nr:unnamed protein product [Paramecium octaurelia]
MVNGVWVVCPDKYRWEEHKSDRYRYEEIQLMKKVQYNKDTKEEEMKTLEENERHCQLNCKQLIDELIKQSKSLGYIPQQMTQKEYIDQNLVEKSQKGKEGRDKALLAIKDKCDELE